MRKLEISQKSLVIKRLKLIPYSKILRGLPIKKSDIKIIHISEYALVWISKKDFDYQTIVRFRDVCPYQDLIIMRGEKYQIDLSTARNAKLFLQEDFYDECRRLGQYIIICYCK